MRLNTILNNSLCGVRVEFKGLGLVEENEIVGNGEVGVSITTGSDPTIKNNTITGGSGVGVRVNEAGGTIERNRIQGNKVAQLETKGGTANLVRNDIRRVSGTSRDS